MNFGNSYYSMRFARSLPVAAMPIPVQQTIATQANLAKC